MHDMVWCGKRPVASSQSDVAPRGVLMLACPPCLLPLPPLTTMAVTNCPCLTHHPPSLLPLPPLTTMAVTNWPCFSASRRMTSSKLKAGLPFVTELPKLKSIDSLESFR